uniref:Uncharacterized protein n=1 Tax=Rhizophora mucronata TaxID=61149 RepID=A0A2P2LJ27_RHIMU
MTLFIISPTFFFLTKLAPFISLYMFVKVKCFQKKKKLPAAIYSRV